MARKKGIALEAYDELKILEAQLRYMRAATYRVSSSAINLQWQAKVIKQQNMIDELIKNHPYQHDFDDDDDVVVICDIDDDEGSHV